MIQYIHHFDREYNVGYSNYCVAYKIDDKGEVLYAVVRNKRYARYNKKLIREQAENVLRERPKSFNIYTLIEEKLYDVLNPGCLKDIPIHNFRQSFLRENINRYILDNWTEEVTECKDICCGS